MISKLSFSAAYLQLSPEIIRHTFFFLVISLLRLIEGWIKEYG